MSFIKSGTGYTVESGVVPDGPACREEDCSERNRYAIRIVNAIPIDDIAALSKVFQAGRGGPGAYMKTGENHFVFVGKLICGHGDDEEDDEPDDGEADDNID